MKIFIVLLSSIFLIHCAPVSNEKAMTYLMHTGFTNKTFKEMTQDDLKEAVEKFQKFVNIPETGVVDEKTKEIMDMPRCVTPDNVTPLYFTGRWNNSHVTFSFINFPSKYYNRSTTTEMVKNGMKFWTDNIDIVVEELVDIERIPDIYIEFVDKSVIKSEKGIVLAYAAPPDDGDMFFINDIGDYEVDLYQLAAHEFGHALGFEHNNDTNSVMFEIFLPRDNFVLNETDKLHATELYGEKYSLCNDGHIDAAFAVSTNTIYILRGFQVWKYNYGTLLSGYPKLLSEDFPGLQSKVNATFFYNNHIYFIQGTQVLKFNGSFVENFATLEREYEAAVTIGERLYTFKGSQYWRYDINNDGMSTVRTDYPRDMSRLWKGVPGDIDAVYYDGDAHFFKETKYYKFDTNALFNNAVEMSISEWDGCKNN